MARSVKAWGDEEISMVLGLVADGMKPLHVAAQVMAYRGVLWLEGKQRSDAMVSRKLVDDLIADLTEKDKTAAAAEESNNLDASPSARKHENFGVDPQLQETPSNVDFDELRSFGVID